MTVGEGFTQLIQVPTVYMYVLETEGTCLSKISRMLEVKGKRQWDRKGSKENQLNAIAIILSSNRDATNCDCDSHNFK